MSSYSHIGLNYTLKYFGSYRGCTQEQFRLQQSKPCKGNGVRHETRDVGRHSCPTTTSAQQQRGQLWGEDVGSGGWLQI